MQIFMPNTRCELRKLYNLKYMKKIPKQFVKANFLSKQKIGFSFVFISNLINLKLKHHLLKYKSNDASASFATSSTNSS